MRTQSYNNELLLAQTQFMDIFSDIVIRKSNDVDFVVSTVFGQRSRIFKDLQNPDKGAFTTPLIVISRMGLTRDTNRISDVNEHLKGVIGEYDYNTWSPNAMNLEFQMSIISKNAMDVERVIGNFIPFFNPDVFVRTNHPKIPDEKQNIQIHWSGDIDEEWPEELDPSDYDFKIATTNFTMKTWIHAGTSEIKTSQCDKIRRVISNWYDVRGDYSLVNLDDISHDIIDVNVFPIPKSVSPLFTKPIMFDATLFGDNFNDDMLIYIHGSEGDDVIEGEEPIIIDGYDTGEIGLQKSFTVIDQYKIIIHNITTFDNGTLDIYTIDVNSECDEPPRLFKLSDNDGLTIHVSEKLYMVSNPMIATYDMRGSFTLPLPSSHTYVGVVDWGDGSPIEEVDSPFPTHNYSISGTYVVRVGGDIPAFSFRTNQSDAHKLITVDDFGITNMINVSGAFKNCVNLISTTGGEMSQITDMSEMYSGCTSLQSINASHWDFTNVITMDNFLLGATLPVDEYSNLIIQLRSQLVQPDVSFNGGNSEYNIASTVDRFKLMRYSNWDIVDGGFYGEMYQPEYNIIMPNTTIRLPLRDTNTYAFVVNWGDGSDWVIIEDPNSIEVLHTYTDVGTYTIEIQGLFESWRDSISNIVESFEILYHVYELQDLVLSLSPVGTYDFEVDWGDGNSDTITAWNDPENHHVYTNPGDYYVKITGLCTKWLHKEQLILEPYELKYAITASNLILDLPLCEGCDYNFVVDWGDGTTSTVTSWNDINRQHTYEFVNLYTLSITGTFTKWSTPESTGMPSGDFILVYNVTASDLFIDLPLIEGFNYDFEVDWGDGTTDVIDSWNDPDKLHEYDIGGTYLISISGICEKWKLPTEMSFNIFMDVNGIATLVMDSEAEKYNYVIDWSDGSTNDITAWNDANRIHTYTAEAGDKELILIGDIDGSVDVTRSYIFEIDATVDFVNVALVMNSASDYSYSVDWGDGNSSTITTPDDADRIHEYATAGNYTIELVGEIDGTISADASDPSLFNITAIDDDIGTLVMASSGTYDFVVDWGDGTSDDHITSYDDPDRIHTYTTSGDYEITTHGLIDGTLSVNMRGEIIESAVIGMMSYGHTYIDTELVPLSGFEFEMDIKPISEYHDERRHGIMGVESKPNGDNSQETTEFYRSRDTDENYGNVWGNPRFDGTYVTRDLLRHTWSKDGLTLSISDIIDNVMPNENFITTNTMYMYARNEIEAGIADYHAKAIVYNLNTWSDSNRAFKTAEWVPVIKGSTLFNSTPAPDHGFWDKINEQYFMPVGDGLHPVKEDIRPIFERPSFGLASTSKLHVNTGIEINKGFSYELDCRYDHIGEPPDSGYAIMGSVLFNTTNIGSSYVGHDYCELIRVKNNRFWYSFGHNSVINTDLATSDHNRHIITRIGDRYSISDVVGHTFNDTTMQRQEIYLYQRNDGDGGGANYYGDWTIFSFRVWADPEQQELIQELLPVPSGETTYSSTPAPSNCFWDTVKEEYIEPIGGSLSIEQDIPPQVDTRVLNFIVNQSNVLFPIADEHILIDDMSVEFDVYSKSSTGSQNLVLCLGDGETPETNIAYGIITADGKLGWIHESGNGSNEIIDSGVTINTNVWTNIKVSRDISAKTLTFTVNGSDTVKSYSTNVNIGTNNTHRLMFGAYWNGASYNMGAEFIGSIKNVLIKDESDEIIVDCKMNESYGNTIFNSGSSVINGQIFGDKIHWIDIDAPVDLGTIMPNAITSWHSIGGSNHNGMTSDGEYLYISDIGNTITKVKISDKSSTTITGISNLNYPRGLAWDGTYFYAGLDNGTILKYNSSWVYIEQFVASTPRYGAGMYCDNGKMYVVNQGNSLTTYNLDNPAVFTTDTLNSANTTGVHITEGYLITNEFPGDMYSLSRSNLSGSKIWTKATGIYIYDDFVYDESTTAYYHLNKNGVISKSTITI